MRRALVWGVLLVGLACVPAQAATRESAEAAVDQALGNVATVVQARAIIALLASLGEGGALTVDLNGTEARFSVQGDAVKVVGVRQHEAPQPGGTGTGAQQPAKAEVCSALVVHLGQTVDVARFGAYLEREGLKADRRSTQAVSFALPTGGGRAAVTSAGTICVQSTEPLTSLRAADDLEATAWGIADQVRQVNQAVRSQQVKAGWLKRRFYSDPPQTLRLLAFPSSVSPAKEGVWRLPAGFQAPLGVPALTISEARLVIEPSSALLGPDPNRKPPAFTLDGQSLSVSSDPLPPPVHPAGWAADLTNALAAGEHVLAPVIAPEEADMTGPCDLTLTVITPSGGTGEIEARLGDATYSSLSSQPLSRIVEDWRDLKEALGGR